ncbi:MAG: hypothetical protein GY786_04625 [Proteobacteria bacterium]|nr:hypothetical protein [Pseudomonadota bacterium]
MKQVVALLLGLLTIGYPLFFFWGIKYFDLRTILPFLVVPFVLRLLIQKRSGVNRSLVGWAVAVFFVWIFLKEDSQYFMLTPVLINFALLIGFGRTLFTSECLIEKLALKQNKNLSPEERVYCRQVNYMWCWVFLFNMAVASYLTWINDLAMWALYNGFLGYLIVGGFGGSELFYRNWRFRHYTGSWSDPFFKKLFPPQI